MSFFHHVSSIHFKQPEEGGDGLNQMIEAEKRETNAIDLFEQPSGEDLCEYIENMSKVIGGVALSDSREQES